MKKTNILLIVLVFILTISTVNAGFLSTTKIVNPTGWEDDGTTIHTLNDNPVNISGNLSIGGGFDRGGIDLTTLGDISLAGDILIQGDILTIIDQEINGSFNPSQDDKFDLGNVSNRWRNLQLSGILNVTGGTILGGVWNQSGTTIFPNLIDSKVGIGTANPGNTLTVIGNVNISKGAILGGDLNMTTHNITDIGALIAPDGSAIRFSVPPPFTGFDQAIIIGNNQDLPTGEISHGFVDFSNNKVLRTFQVGEPDGAGFMRNSQIISSQFGIVNGTKLSRCSEMAAQMGGPNGLELDGVGCNSTDLGSALVIEGSTRIGHRLVVGGGNKSTYGLQVQGFAEFNMEGQDFNIFNGSLHPQTPRIEEIGFATGQLVTMIDEDFEDNSISPFQKREQIGSDLDNWDADEDLDFCFDGECARAKGGDSRSPRIMETNVSTVDRNKLNISFWIGVRAIDTTDNLSVQVIDGANSVMIYNFTGTGAASNTDISPPEFITALIPSSFDDLSKVSIRFNMSSDKGGTAASREEFWVDNVLMVGTATASTRENLTRRDTIILLGNGNQRIFWNDSSNVLELPSNVTIIAETIQDLFVSGTFTLGGAVISDLLTLQFEDSGWKRLNATSQGFIANNSDANLSSLQYANGPVPCTQANGDAGMIYTNGTTSICQVYTNHSVWNRTGNDIFNSDFDGNVGIGTASPNNALSVIGAVDITGSLNVSKDTVILGNVVVGGVFNNIFSNEIVHVEGIIANDDVIGIKSVPTISGSRNSVIGINIEVLTDEFSDVTNSYGILVNEPAHGIGSSATNVYMLYLKPATGGDVLNYGIYTESGPHRLAGIVNISDSLNVTNTVQATDFIGDGSELTGISANGSLWNSTTGNIYPSDIIANVGIGTTSPTSPLDVNGNVTIRGNLTVLAENATFNQDITVIGTIHGGSPVKITGGLIIDGGNVNISSDYNFTSGYYTTLNEIGSYGDELLITAEGAIRYMDENETVDVMFLNVTSGYIGMGTITPTSKLHVIGNVNITGNLSLQFGELVSELNPDGVNATRIKATSSDVDVVLGDSTGYFSVWNAADDTAVFFVNNVGNTDVLGDLTIGDDIFMSEDGVIGISASAERIVFDGTGGYINLLGAKVGIGTSSPDSIFHIKADIAGSVGSHSAGQIIIQNPADTVFANAVITGYESDGSGNPDQQLWYLGSSSSSNSNIIFLNRRNALLQFGTNDNTQMTILGNGNIGIGTTSPTQKLVVVGDVNVSNGNLSIMNIQGGTDGCTVRWNATTGNLYC